MNGTIQDVLQFVQENDVKFIRLAFCDIFGAQKNISIMPGELPRAFASGIPFDADAIPGFGNPEGPELLLFPDPPTMAILPWRPSQGRVLRFFCDIRRPNGNPFEGDGRELLRKAARRCAGMGYTCKIGAECEFYLFDLDDRGRPTSHPFDSGEYFDVAPLDKGENVRREICLTLEEMGILPESSHHEQGPGQNEIDFRYGDALEAADNLITFQSVVKIISAQNGLHASFLPKPFPDKNGSGLHINLSLSRNGQNLFCGAQGVGGEVPGFISGVLARAAESALFLNPLTNSYSRLNALASPNPVRIPPETGERGRMELRTPDPACNPYLAFSLLIHAGLDGIAGGVLPSGDAAPLPSTLEEAVSMARDSAFVRRVIPENTLRNFLEAKAGEWTKYSLARDKSGFEREQYFYSI